MATRDFDNPLAFAMHLATLSVTIHRAEHRAMDQVGKLVEKDAKARLGEYQQTVGPFPSWDSLADSTKADRVRQGYPEDQPGVRSGEMRDSITHEASAHDVVIGSPEEKMLWFELGTEKQPPRPALGPAVFSNKDEIASTIGKAVAEGMANGAVIGPTKGYSFDID